MRLTEETVPDSQPDKEDKRPGEGGGTRGTVAGLEQDRNP